MSKYVIGFIIAGILAMGSGFAANINVALDKNIKSEEKIYLEVGEEAPNFTLKNLQEEKISLSDFRGKNVLINFWDTKSPYCVKEMADLNELYIDNRDKDFVVLGIPVGDSKEEVEAYLKDKGYAFPILLDEEKNISIEYMVRGIPTSYMIDKEGTISDIKLSMMTYPQMQKILKDTQEK